MGGNGLIGEIERILGKATPAAAFANLLYGRNGSAGDGLSPAWLARNAREAGVRLLSLGDFSMTRTCHGLLFGYGAITAENIGPGLQRLRRVFDEGER